MRSPVELRNDAMDCMRLAEEAKAPQHKSLFLMMAQAWSMLAEQAEHMDALGEADETSKQKAKPH